MNPEKKKKSEQNFLGILTFPELPDGLTRFDYVINGKKIMTDCINRQEFAERKTTGPMPMPQVNERYKDAIYQMQDLERLCGVPENSDEMTKMIQRFFRSVVPEKGTLTVNDR
jgi:hypothetical protein